MAGGSAPLTKTYTAMNNEITTTRHHDGDRPIRRKRTPRITPTCEPLTENICAVPLAAYACIDVNSNPDLSPMTTATAIHASLRGK